MNGIIWLSLRHGVSCGLIVKSDLITHAPPYAHSRGWRVGRDAHEVWLELAVLHETEELRWLPDPIGQKPLRQAP